MKKNLFVLDKLSTILGIFILLISALFYTLYLSEEKVSAFAQTDEQVVELKLLNKDFNALAFKLNHLVNYDNVNQKKEHFEALFHSLKDKLVHKDKHYQQAIASIEKAYEEKIDNLEYFKSQNAALLNTSHFLFDLQRTISEDTRLSLQTKNLINETLFFLLQYANDNTIDPKILKQKLQFIADIQHQHNINYLQTFIAHAHLFIQTLHTLKELTKSIHNQQLETALDRLQNKLLQEYNRNLGIQKLLSFVFFILSVFVLLLLIQTHLKTLKTQKELLAFQYAMRHSDNMIVITNPQREITFVNKAFEEATGYTKEEVLGKNPSILKSGLQNTQFYKKLYYDLEKYGSWQGELINKRKDGSLLYEKASIVPVYLDNKLISYLAIKLDITDFIEKNKKLAQAASVFENTEEAIIIADKHAHIVSVNRAFHTIFGYSLQEMQKKKYTILYSQTQNRNFYKNIWRQVQEYGIWKGKLLTKNKSGEIIPVWTIVQKITNSKGEVVNYTVIQTDLREVESSQAKANYLAYHDALTGLYNRVHFEEYLQHTLAIAKRTHKTLAVLFIDLDRFKIINDTLGHATGDKMLIEVANRLKKTLRESDFISRWGGDEFVVILESLDDVTTSTIVARNIIQALKQPFTIDSHKLIVTASIGIALYPENGQDSSSLIKHADSAMYLAKERGKDTFQYYTNTLSQDIRKKMDIDLALHSALENGEFFVVFQPQYLLNNKKVQAAEALIRWKNDTLGFIGPDEFIPIAEENGTIIALGYFVFEQSCAALVRMREHGIVMQHIAVNVSTLQFKEAGLLSNFLSILKIYKLQACDIEIEITERFMVEDTQANLQLLSEFRQHGFKISIDDFGTGYSSMSYLKKLSIDTLKVDKSFVDDIGTLQENNTVVEAIIALAQKLEYTVVAEGIETPQQEEFLNKAGCHYGQGYLFSKPVSCEEFIERFGS